MLSMLQTKPWQQSAGSCQHLDCSHPRVWFYITSSKQQQELVWNEKPSKVMPGPTCKHVCVCRENLVRPAVDRSMVTWAQASTSVVGPPQAQLSRSADHHTVPLKSNLYVTSSTLSSDLANAFLYTPTSKDWTIIWGYARKLQEKNQRLAFGPGISHHLVSTEPKRVPIF